MRGVPKNCGASGIWRGTVLTCSERLLAGDSVLDHLRRFGRPPSTPKEPKPQTTPRPFRAQKTKTANYLSSPFLTSHISYLHCTQ